MAALNSNVLSGRKNGESDMEEKFGRFELKPEVGFGIIFMYEIFTHRLSYRL